MEKINFVNNTTPALNATNLNKLQDNVEDYINSFDSYSTSEVKTGKTWINSKPIYRKTIVFTTTVQANTLFSVSHSILNIDTIVNLNARMYNTSIKKLYTLPIVGYDDSLTLKINTYADYQKIYMYSNDGWGTGWQKIFTIEYTKTTD